MNSYYHKLRMRKVPRHFFSWIFIDNPAAKLGHCANHSHFFFVPGVSKLFSRANSEEKRVADGLKRENYFFGTSQLTGTRFFPASLGLDTDGLQQRWPSLWCPSKNWTSPTSTTWEIRTVVRGPVSTIADAAALSAPNQRSRTSLRVFLHRKTFFWQDCRSAKTAPVSSPKALQGSNSELCWKVFSAASAVFSMLIPVSERKFLCVNSK